MKKILLVNVVEPEESRIAILEDGVLEELYIEFPRISHITTVLTGGPIGAVRTKPVIAN